MKADSTDSIECNCHEVQTPVKYWRNCAKSDELDYRNVKDCKEKSIKKIYFVVKLRKKVGVDSLWGGCKGQCTGHCGQKLKDTVESAAIP